VNDPWTLVYAAAALLVPALIGCLVALRRTRRELTQTRLEAAELRSRVDALAEQLRVPEPAPTTAPSTAPTEFVITAMGVDNADEPPVQRLEGRLFADIVLRETVVRAVSLTHGVRRALAPETRNRIRFEMRREVKRSRKQRRADTKAALRDWEARQRTLVDLDDEDAA